MRKCFIIGYGIVEKKFFNDIIINEILEIIESLTFDYHEIYVDCYGELEKVLYNRLKDKSRDKSVLPIFSLNTSKIKLNTNTMMNNQEIGLTKCLIGKSLDAIFLSTRKHLHIVNFMVNFAKNCDVKNYAVDLDALFDSIVL